MLFPWYIKYPNQNDEILNLDWILSTIDNLVKEVSDFVTLNTIKYADPIQWNITTQYEKNTVVIDPITGSAYISTQPVPSGVGLNNTDYWNIIFTLDVISANKNITLRDDANNMFATFESKVDDWLLWQGTLYRVTRDIDIGQAYVKDYNIERYTVEMYLKTYISNLGTYVNNLAGSLADLETSDNSNLVAAINSVLSDLGDSISSLGDKIGDLDDLNTVDKSNVVAAINELIITLNSQASAIGNLANIINIVNSKLKSWDVRTNGKIIFLGDSYGKWDNQAWPKWTDNVAQLLGLGTENVDWWNLAAPSTALANGDFLNAITTWVTNHPDQINEIGAVVICSGINDAASVYLPNIYTQINALATYIKNNLPKAIAYIGYIGWLDESTVPSDTRVAYLREQVAEAYMRSESFGMRYLNGVENFYHDKRIVADGIHPTSDGAVRIAEGIVNALTNGAASVANHFSASPTAYEGTIGGTFSQHLQNGIITTTIDGIAINYGASPKVVNAGDNLAIANCNTAFSNGVDFGLHNISITSGGVNMTALGRLYIDKNTNILYFKVFSFSSGNAYETLQYINGIYANATQSTLQC